MWYRVETAVRNALRREIPGCKHATKHFHKTTHPVIKSFEPGEDWGYCYADDIYYEMLNVNVGSYHS